MKNKTMKNNISEQELYKLQASLCQMMAHPKRIELFEMLSQEELSVTVMAKQLGITVPATSQHLRLFRENGMAVTRRDGQTIYYSITKPKLMDGCKIMRNFLLEELENKK